MKIEKIFLEITDVKCVCCRQKKKKLLSFNRFKEVEVTICLDCLMREEDIQVQGEDVQFI